MYQLSFIFLKTVIFHKSCKIFISYSKFFLVYELFLSFMLNTCCLSKFNLRKGFYKLAHSSICVSTNWHICGKQLTPKSIKICMQFGLTNCERIGKKWNQYLRNELKRQTTHQAYLAGKRTVPVNIRYYPEKSGGKKLLTYWDDDCIKDICDEGKVESGKLETSLITKWTKFTNFLS